MNLHNQTDQEDEETGEKPLPYSPISGFLNLPPDEEIPAGIHPSYSDNYMSRGDDHDLFFYESTDELEEEESTNLDTLGLQVGPFQQSKETRLSKHTSSQTLKAQSGVLTKATIMKVLIGVRRYRIKDKLVVTHGRHLLAESKQSQMLLNWTMIPTLPQL